MPIEHHYLARGGYRWHVVTDGPEDAPPALLLQGRLGWRLQLGGAMLETGAKFYLPFSLDPFAWQMHDRAGGVTAAGVGYGGTALLPTVLFYLETEL